MNQAGVLRPIDRARLAKWLAWAMALVVSVHLLLPILLNPGPVLASRCCTAAVAFLSSGCVVVRLLLLPAEERPTWFWAAVGMFLWGLAHAIETFLGHSVAASNLTVDAADFIYVASIFPLLLVFSTTREIQSLRVVFFFNCLQIALACVLAYVLLYRMELAPALAATVMGRIYGAACALIAVMSVLRSLSWLTNEERRCVRWISAFLWIYLPIEFGMDYATQHWDLHAGTLLDLVWSVPFALTSWKALTLPIEQTRLRLTPERSNSRLLVECLCPMLINAGIFALGAAVIRQHLVLGLFALFVLLVIQGVQAAVIQMNYLAGRKLLLDREQDLRVANAALQKLSLLDPLTGIANRRRFDAELRVAWKRAVRHRYPLSLLIIDIDFFKGVNDLHGHTYGDECLMALARVMTQQARRADDLVARFGGEEFIFLLPDTGPEGALAIAEHLHQAVSGLGIGNEASPFDCRLTVSIGIATAEPGLAAEPLSLIEAADRALYEAKAGGRNCTRAGAVVAAG